MLPDWFILKINILKFLVERKATTLVVNNHKVLNTLLSGLCGATLLGVVEGTDGKRWQREYSSKFIKCEIMSINSGEKWEEPGVEFPYLFELAKYFSSHSH